MNSSLIYRSKKFLILQDPVGTGEAATVPRELAATTAGGQRRRRRGRRRSAGRASPVVAAAAEVAATGECGGNGGEWRRKVGAAGG